MRYVCPWHMSKYAWEGLPDSMLPRTGSTPQNDRKNNVKGKRSAKRLSVLPGDFGCKIIASEILCSDNRSCALSSFTPKDREPAKSDGESDKCVIDEITRSARKCHLNPISGRPDLRIKPANRQVKTISFPTIYIAILRGAQAA